MGNAKQIKMDMNLPKLIEDFGTNERCRTYLEMLRWQNGPQCPRCESGKVSPIKDRPQYDCDACHYQFSVTTGTVLHDTHLPLWKWFAATYMMIEAKKGVSANQLKRTLSVSYKTAWYLCHRIRKAMESVNAAPLTGTVEVDETYVGGKLRHVVHTNGIEGAWSLFKRSVVGSYHQVSKKHLDRYLDEFQF
ncbi:MAG TPA: IS1595 family transposase, partial [Thermoanaerobaculia bacterium]|nr:IS1595 family transposase [Thermoanaerobaculia bacterium]